MSDFPIIMSAPMVRAMLAGRKTMTRRLAPYGSRWMRVLPRDRLWVRERWCQPSEANEERYAVYWADLTLEQQKDHHEVMRWTRAERGPEYRPWRPSIHMPRWASRLTLIVTAAKIERLQDISKDDVLAEGIRERDGAPLENVYAGWHEPFAALWDSLHGVGAWDANPEIVCLSFDVIKANIDTLASAGGRNHSGSGGGA